jgi:hypothetical protein
MGLKLAESASFGFYRWTPMGPRAGKSFTRE